MTLSHDAGLVIYPTETAQDPLTVERWDDYLTGNWANRPSSVWVAATQTGEKHVYMTFSAQSNMGTEQVPDWGGGESDATVTFNCLLLNLQLDGKGESVEEDPGVYINVNWDDDDGDGWTNNGAPPDATYTGDKDDAEVNPADGNGDDDLRECVLSASGPFDGGTVDLTFPAKIKCWGTRTKKDGGQSSEISSGTQIPVGDLPKTFYVEGVSGSLVSRDTVLTATYSGDAGVTDKVNITVFEITLKGFYSGPKQWDDDVSYSALHISSGRNGLISWDDANGDGITGDEDSNCKFFANCMETQGTIWPVIGTYGVEFSFKQDIRRVLFTAAQDSWNGVERDNTWREDSPAVWQMDTIPSEYGLVYKCSVDSLPTEDDYIYTVDGPGWGRLHLSEGSHYVGQVCDFRVYAVMVSSGVEYQCSDWFKWHSKLYLMPKDDGWNLTRDARALQLLGDGWIEIPEDPERQLP